MLAERSPDEQSDVGPTLASNVGPTKLTTLSQRWPKVVMLSGMFIVSDEHDGYITQLEEYLHGKCEALCFSPGRATIFPPL